MDNKFCNNCNNMLYLYTNEDKELYYGCKVCSNVIKHDNNNDKIHYNLSELKKTSILNNNVNLINDITLPIINNSIIKCINSECSDKTKPIKYIKYDNENIKYIYICTNCGQKWNN